MLQMKALIILLLQIKKYTVFVFLLRIKQKEQHIVTNILLVKPLMLSANDFLTIKCCSHWKNVSPDTKLLQYRFTLHLNNDFIRTTIPQNYSVLVIYMS